MDGRDALDLLISAECATSVLESETEEQIAQNCAAYVLIEVDDVVAACQLVRNALHGSCPALLLLTPSCPELLEETASTAPPPETEHVKHRRQNRGEFERLSTNGEHLRVIPAPQFSRHRPRKDILDDFRRIASHCQLETPTAVRRITNNCADSIFDLSV